MLQKEGEHTHTHTYTERDTQRDTDLERFNTIKTIFVFVPFEENYKKNCAVLFAFVNGEGVSVSCALCLWSPSPSPCSVVVKSALHALETVVSVCLSHSGGIAVENIASVYRGKQ